MSVLCTKTTDNIMYKNYIDMEKLCTYNQMLTMVKE